MDPYLISEVVDSYERINALVRIVDGLFELMIFSSLQELFSLMKRIPSVESP
jgi:hypothetical protein